MLVKSFNKKELKEHLKKCDPYILKYIEALKNNAKRWEDLAHFAIEKNRSISL